VEDYLSLAVGSFEPGQEFAPKYFGESPHRKEKAPLFASDPARAVQAQAAPGDDTVKMDVGHEGLPPGMQDRREAQLRSQMAGIAGKLFKSFSHRLEEAIIEQPLITANHLVEGMRESKNEVEVGNRQQ
jgi:hypothetical protein